MVSYNKLWKLLIDKNMNKKDLIALLHCTKQIRTCLLLRKIVVHVHEPSIESKDTMFPKKPNSRWAGRCLRRCSGPVDVTNIRP